MADAARPDVVRHNRCKSAHILWQRFRFTLLTHLRANRRNDKAHLLGMRTQNLSSHHLLLCSRSVAEGAALAPLQGNRSESDRSAARANIATHSAQINPNFDFFILFSIIYAKHNDIGRFCCARRKSWFLANRHLARWSAGNRARGHSIPHHDFILVRTLMSAAALPANHHSEGRDPRCQKNYLESMP